MKSENCLGIYLSKTVATVACCSAEATRLNLIDSFSVSTEEQDQPTLQTLITSIADNCAERKLEFSDIAVAVDCAMFMQHAIHSEFTDPKQIAATVKFDAEEALAMDITELALAFKINSADNTGSGLTAFTTSKKQLSDILTSLQSNNMDPVTIEPDINCLSKFILLNSSLPQDANSIICLLSQSSCYLFTLSTSQQILNTRTLPLSPSQDRNNWLAKQLPLTAALTQTDEPINQIRIFDSTNTVNTQLLSKQLALQISEFDLLQNISADQQTVADCPDPVNLAIAAGAALSTIDKTPTANFRTDFMPYQGKKLRMQKALKILSVSVAVLVFAIGLNLQLKLLKQKRYSSQLRKVIAKDYASVTFGSKLTAKDNPVRKLGSVLRQIKNLKGGQLSITGQLSAAAKLTLVLEAFNSCAKQVNLQIDSINITTKTINITGNTSNRKNTLKLFESIRKNRLNVTQQRLDSKAGRDNFSISVVPKG